MAEILERLVPATQELGINARWEVIEGDERFFAATKSFHNALQGAPTTIPETLLRHYEEINAANAEKLRPLLEDAWAVFIHDPQPAPLLGLCPERRGKWVWRCHIDLSAPHPPVWHYLLRHVSGYDASVFSMPAYSQALPHLQAVMAPAIDPMSEKNIDLSAAEIEETALRFGLDIKRPMAVQISRFDRFKDPLGVLRAWEIARKKVPGLQLVLAGGGASDDPEGEAVLKEVRTAANGDPDAHILPLPPDAHRTINALQRMASVVLQKSTKEGFGLTVSEALWKERPFIGGNVGGIRLQVIEGVTGHLVNTPEGAAFRMQTLLKDRESAMRMGKAGKEWVRSRFLLSRLLRDELVLLASLAEGAPNPLEIS